MELFERLAPHVVLYHLRANWLSVSKLFNDLAKEYDSTMAMAFVLLAIDEGTGTPVTKIAPRIGMEPNSLSRLLNSLEDKGAIYRENDTKDQRKVYVSLTDLGKSLRIVAIQSVIEVEKEITKGLTKEEKRVILKFMGNIGNAIKSMRSNIDQLKEDRKHINVNTAEIISQLL
ncbi:MAG: MarR family transcriptional regulator [Chitinophagales bacterium]|nr:MarR family transcriptional regulator [Chitinophagales bacterium]MCZ2392611.1 MarR family transcriptional regulator [Chitinophagales bacterium]